MRRFWTVIIGLMFMCAARADEPTSAPVGVQQWDVYEVSLKGPSEGNPFEDVKFSARFTSGNTNIDVPGFYDGDSIYRVRFMPRALGAWTYQTQSNRPELTGTAGEFICVQPDKTNHGPVRVRNTYHFAYEDGTPFKPITTTSYGWVFQNDELEEQTLATLKESPFNKLRMCVQPIPYRAAKEPLKLFPFAKSTDGKPDFSHFDPRYFQHLERRIAQLRDMNIEADVILFNPYNNALAFNTMSAADDDRYVRYTVARLAAYRNIWWSMANEFDLIRSRTTSDFDRLGKLVQHEDPYDHLRSIHFSKNIFEPAAPWVTHISVQNGNAVADFGRASLYRDACAKPVVYDEVCYEGDLDKRWGQLSGEEMTMRFWLATIGGTYCGHGEVHMDNSVPSWTALGVNLLGKSPPRIAFLKKIIDDSLPEGIEPLDRYFEDNIAGKPGEYYLIYFGKREPTEWRFELYKDHLEDGMKFHADVLDTWSMTIAPIDKPFILKRHDAYTFRDENDAKIALPGKPYVALRIARKR